LAIVVGWELEFRSHLEWRMEDGELTEVDLRRMLQVARRYREEAVVYGRLVVVAAYRSFGSRSMKQPYLEVTYRKEKPLAAYLPREVGAHAARTEDGGSGLRIDYDVIGKPIGIEITAALAESELQ
jgi:hypothetical protein